MADKDENVFFLTGRSPKESPIPLKYYIRGINWFTLFLSLIILCSLGYSLIFFFSIDLYIYIGVAFLSLISILYHLIFTIGTYPLKIIHRGVTFIFHDYQDFLEPNEIELMFKLLLDKRFNLYVDEGELNKYLKDLTVVALEDPPEPFSKVRTDSKNNIIYIYSPYINDFFTFGYALYNYFIDRIEEEELNNTQKKAWLRRKSLLNPPTHKPYLPIYSKIYDIKWENLSK